MFYSTQILARKGPLGIVWIAAHMDKQLKRSQVRGRGVWAASRGMRGSGPYTLAWLHAPKAAPVPPLGQAGKHAHTHAPPQAMLRSTCPFQTMFLFLHRLQRCTSPSLWMRC